MLLMSAMLLGDANILSQVRYHAEYNMTLNHTLFI